LHPDARVEQNELDIFVISLGRFTGRLRFLTTGTADIQQSWYCPKFGRRELAPAISWTASGELPIFCGWQLSWDENLGVGRLEFQIKNKPWLIWTDDRREVRLEINF
jgi:hypothetical protein